MRNVISKTLGAAVILALWVVWLRSDHAMAVIWGVPILILFVNVAIFFWRSDCPLIKFMATLPLFIVILSYGVTAALVLPERVWHGMWYVVWALCCAGILVTLGNVYAILTYADRIGYFEPETLVWPLASCTWGERARRA